MRSASFEYWPNQKVIKAYGLSYAFCPNQAYEFEYNRSRLIIDTRFFNQPVAFEKTAAGFIRDTILDLKKVYHDVDLITFNNKTRFEIDKISKPESILNDVAIYKIQYDSGIHHYVFFKMLKNTFINYNNEMEEEKNSQTKINNCIYSPRRRKNCNDSLFGHGGWKTLSFAY